MNRSILIRIVLCLGFLLSYSLMAWAGPHHASANDEHVRAKSHASAAKSPASDVGDASVDSSQGTGQTDTMGDQGTGTGAEEATSGVDSGGTVRVNNLANLEALLNILANGAEILGVAIGGPLCLFGVPAGLILLFMKGKRWIGAILLVTGPVILGTGLLIPGLINYLVACVRDAGGFN